LAAPALGAGTALPADGLAPTLFEGRRVTPADDLLAILREAPEDTELQLTEGTFLLREAVTLPRRVVLNGAGRERTRIVGRGAEFVLRATAPTGVALRNLTVSHEGNVAADAMWIQHGHVELLDCRFRGARGRGLWLAGEASGTVRRCEFLDNAAAGLAIGGLATPLVDQCTARGNRGEGICVRDEARPVLSGNRAVVNYQAGIAFCDAAGGMARENLCAQNGLSGLALFDHAAPELTANTLRANNRSGLAYWNQAAGTASENVCEDNLHDGIEVHDAAKPHLLRNVARRNQGAGLAFCGRAGGMALQNRCEANAAHGLAQRDQAAPTVAGNLFAGNGQGAATPPRLAAL
jgi:parallel beta-helix repeat protein